MGVVSYSSPKSFEDMAEVEVVGSVGVEVEAVADPNKIEVAKEVIEPEIGTGKVISAETDRNDIPTV